MNSEKSKQVKKLPKPSMKAKDFAKLMLAAYRRRKKRKLKRNRFSKDNHLSDGKCYKIIFNSRHVRRKLFPHQLPVKVALPSKTNYSFLFSKPICSVGSGRGGQRRKNQEYRPPGVKRKRGRPKRTDSSGIWRVMFFSGVEHFGSFFYDARCFGQPKDGRAVRNDYSSVLKSAALKSNIVVDNMEDDKPENDAFQMSCVQRMQPEISFLEQVNTTGAMPKPLDSSGFEGHSGVIINLRLESQEPFPAVVVSGITEVKSSCGKEGPHKDDAQSILSAVEEECIEAGYGNDDDDDASLLQITTATVHSEAPKGSRRKGKCQRISLGTKTKSKGHMDEGGSVVKKPRFDVQKGTSTVGVPASHSSNGRGQVCKGVYRSYCNSKRCSDALAQNDWYCLQVNSTGIRLKRDKRKRVLEEKEPQRSAVKMLNQCKPCSVVLVDFLKCLNLATSAAPCSSAPCQLAPNWNDTLSCQYAADRTLRLFPGSEAHDGVASWSDRAEDRFGSLPPVTTSLENGNELLHAVEFYSSFDCAAESYCVWSVVDLDGAQNAVSLTIPDVEHDAAATPDVRTDDRNVLFRLPKLQKICDFAVRSLKSAATSEPVTMPVHEEHRPILAEDVVPNASVLLSKEPEHDCLEMSKGEDQEIVPVMEANPARFSCLHCIYKTSDHSSIREHVYIHTDVIPFTCGHCGSLFGTRSNVSLHSEREHAHDKPHIVEDSTVCVEKHYQIESFVPGKSKNSVFADMFYTSSEFTNSNIDLMKTTIDTKNDKADDKRKNIPTIDAGEPCEASENKKDFAIEVLLTEDSDICNLGTDTDGINLIGLQDAKNQFSSCGSLNQELVTICESCPLSGSDHIEVNQKVEQHDTNKISEYLDVNNVIFVPFDTHSSSHFHSRECSSFDNFNSECQEDAMFSEKHDTLQNMDAMRVNKISIDTDTALPSTVSLATTLSFGEISIITCSSASDDSSLSSPILSVSNDGMQKPSKLKPCSKQYCCQYCDYSTSEVSDIETHVFVMHPRQRRLVCPVCDVYFCKFKPTMLAHFSSQHRKVKPVFIYEPSYRLLTADTGLPATRAEVRTKKKLARVCAGSPQKSRRGKQNARISKVISKVSVLDDVVSGREGSGIRDVNVDSDPKDWGSVSAQRLEDIAKSCVWSECLDREGHEVQDAGIVIGSDKPDSVLPQIQNDQEQSCIWFECSMAPFEDCSESNCSSGVLTERQSEIVIQIDNSSILEKQVAETVELDRCSLENGDESVVREGFIHEEKPSSFGIVSGDGDKLRGAEISGETEGTFHIQSKDFEIVEHKNDKESAVDDCCNNINNNNHNNNINNSQEFSAVGFVDYLNNRESVLAEVAAKTQSEESQENCCEDGESTNVQESFCQDFCENFTSVILPEKSSLTEAGELITEEALCEQTSTDMDGKPVDYLSLEKKISDSNGAKFDCDEAIVHGASFDEKKYSGLDDIENAEQCIVEKSSCETIDLSSTEHTACQGITEVDKEIQDGTKIMDPGNCHKNEGTMIDRNEFDAKTVEQDKAFPSGKVIQEKQCLEEESEGDIQRDLGVRDVELEAEFEFSVQRNTEHSLNEIHDYPGRSANVGESVEVRNLSSDVNPDHDNFPKNLGSCSDVQSCDSDRGGCASSNGALSSCSEGPIISGIHVQDEVIEIQSVGLHEEPETDEVISCLYLRISDDDTISERDSDGHTDDSNPLKILMTDDRRITDKGSAPETGEHQNDVEPDRLKSCDENELNGKNPDHLESASNTVFIDIDDDTIEPTDGCIQGASRPCCHVSRCSSAAVATASIEPESTSSKDGTDQVVHHAGSRREEGAPPEDCMCLEVSSTSDDSGVILSERGLCDRRLARRSAALVSCEVREEEEVLDVENCAEEDQLESGRGAIGAEDGSKGPAETMCELCSFVSNCGTEMLLHMQDAHRENSSRNSVHDVDFCGKVVEDSIAVIREPNNNKIDQTQRVYPLDAVELKNSQPKPSNHSHIEIQLPDDDDDDDDENDVIFMGLEKHHVTTDPAGAYPVSPTNYMSNIARIDNVTSTHATCYSITNPLSTKRTAACRLNPISSASHTVPVGVSRRRHRRDVELSKSRERLASPAESRTGSPVDANSVCIHHAMDSKQLLTNSNPRPSNSASIAFVTRSISRPIMTSTLHPMPAHTAEPSRAISSAYERKTLPSATVTANQGGTDVLLDCRVSQRRDVGGPGRHFATDGLPPLIPISELRVMRQPLPAHSNYREFPLAGQYGSHNANLSSREILWGRAAQSQEKAQARPAFPPPAHSKLQVGSGFMKPNSWTGIDNSGFNRNGGHVDSSRYRYSAPDLPPVNRAVRDSDAGRRRVAVESHRPLGEQFGREPRRETLAKHPHPGAPFGQNARLPHHPTSTYPGGSATASPVANSCLLCPFQTTDSWSLYHHLQSHIGP